MERKVGEIFKYNGVTLITIENNSCEGCFFNNRDICTIGNRLLLCSSIFRKDNKNVIFREDNKNVIFRKMETTRTVKLTLEKAKEFYKKGGEFRDLALSAFTEEELTKVELPKTWEEFCSKYGVQNEYYIGSDSTIKRAHLALIKLHQLRDCYRQGWTPDWSDGKNKYCIVYSGRCYDTNSNYFITAYTCNRTFLSFQTKEIAKLFLKNFRSLIEAAGDLV